MRRLWRGINSDDRRTRTKLRDDVFQHHAASIRRRCNTAVGHNRRGLPHDVTGAWIIGLDKGKERVLVDMADRRALDAA